MGTKERSAVPEDTSLLLAKYNALRTEILKRMEVENQLATFTVIVFGTILERVLEMAQVSECKK